MKKRISDYYLLSDEELLIEMINDNESAFTELYNRHKKSLYVHAYQKLGDVDDVEDVLQELFSSIWLNRRNLSIQKDFSAYVFISLRNRSIDFMIKKGRQSKYETSFIDFAETYVNDTDHVVREKVFLDQIHSLLEKHSPTQRKIFELKVIKGLSNAEIAEELGISEKTVRNQASLLAKKLKSKIYTIIFSFLF